MGVLRKLFLGLLTVCCCHEALADPTYDAKDTGVADEKEVMAEDNLAKAPLFPKGKDNRKFTFRYEDKAGNRKSVDDVVAKGEVETDPGTHNWRFKQPRTLKMPGFEKKGWTRTWQEWWNGQPVPEELVISGIPEPATWLLGLTGVAAVIGSRAWKGRRPKNGG